MVISVDFPNKVAILEGSSTTFSAQRRGKETEDDGEEELGG